MLAVWEVLASALYLMPVAVVVAVCWSRERAPAELAIYIPVGVAVDLLAILLLARLCRLDAAIVISRVAWAAAGGGLGLWRRRQARVKASALAGPVVLVMAVAGLLALVISAWLSRRYALWDRQWHIPLVTSLRGQSLPFWNVSEPGAPLHYHVSGDVLAATLQALSGARLHASPALSLAHDLMFALMGVAVSALLVRPGSAFGWSAFAAVAPLGVLLAGPPSTTVGLTGFSYFNYYQMSYRPHVALAGLLIVGIVAAVRELFPPQGQAARLSIGSVLPLLALLAITDEPSAAIVVPAIVLVVVMRRRALAGRLSWPVIAACLPGVVLVAILILPSTLLGGHGPGVRVVAPRVASFFAPSLSLSSMRGLRTLLVDLAPLLAMLLLLGGIVARTKQRHLAALVGFGAVALGFGCALLTCLEVGGSPAESHRFMTLPEVVLPLLLLSVVNLASRPERVIMALVLVVSVVFTVAWEVSAESEVLKPDFLPDSFAQGIHHVDCREATGARLFETPRPTYAPKDIWYMWTGCRPVLAPSEKPPPEYLVNSKRPLFGAPALAAFERDFLSPDGDLTVACPLTSQNEPICRYALGRGRCAPAGDRWQSCTLAPADRRDLRRALETNPR